MSYKRALKKALDPKSEDRTPLHEFVPHILEGTAFAGVSRQHMRAQGVRNTYKEKKPAPEHWLRKRLREIAMGQGVLDEVQTVD